MFTVPSLTKLLVLAAILLAVWFGFRLIGQLSQARAEADRLDQGAKSPAQSRRAQKDKSKRTAIQDTVKCAVCDAYVPVPGATSCGRADCPY